MRALPLSLPDPTQPHPRRWRVAWLAPAALASAALLLLSACQESKDCPTLPDAGRADLAPGDLAGDRGPDQASACRQSEVQCAGDEINAFGLCLGQSAMASIPAGAFAMGHTEPGKPYSPEHQVTLEAFLIDKTEVTLAQYAACVDCGVCARPLRDGSHTAREPYYGNAEFSDYPVIYVNWTDAKTYCEAIGKRLPSEAEWERAARGSDGRTYPWGEQAPAKGRANFLGVRNDTLPVTDNAEGASPAGALNMSGNVWEWVADSFDAGYYASSPAQDPPGPPESPLKVMRGGGFASPAEQIRSFVRAGEAQDAAYSSLGFRCAVDAWPVP